MSTALLVGGGLLAYLILRPKSTSVSPMVANPLIGGSGAPSSDLLSGLEAFSTAALGIRPTAPVVTNPIISQSSIDNSLAFQPDFGPAYLTPEAPDVESDLSSSESAPDLSYLGGLNTGADLPAPTE